jgi:hypothetical protein
MASSTFDSFLAGYRSSACDYTTQTAS